MSLEGLDARNVAFEGRTDEEIADVSDLAVLGAPGEDKRKGLAAPNHGVTIGARTVVREFATVHGGFHAPTRIGADCYVMAHSHVGHDCWIGDNVTLSTRVTLGGHTIIHEGANVGLGAITHQHTTIGAYAMVGMGAVVTRDVPPFAMVYGNPARQHGYNVVGMERAGYSAEQIADVCAGKRTPWHDLFDRDAGRRGK